MHQYVLRDEFPAILLLGKCSFLFKRLWLGFYRTYSMWIGKSHAFTMGYKGYAANKQNRCKQNRYTGKKKKRKKKETAANRKQALNGTIHTREQGQRPYIRPMGQAYRSPTHSKHVDHSIDLVNGQLLQTISV